jgi:hypothetical protein
VGKRVKGGPCGVAAGRVVHEAREQGGGADLAQVVIKGE